MCPAHAGPIVGRGWSCGPRATYLPWTPTFREPISDECSARPDHASINNGAAASIRRWPRPTDRHPYGIQQCHAVACLIPRGSLSTRFYRFSCYSASTADITLTVAVCRFAATLYHCVAAGQLGATIFTPCS